MVRHDLKPTSLDDLDSILELAATDPAEPPAPTDKFREQLYSSERLIEYYNQVVREIRASLDRAENEGR